MTRSLYVHFPFCESKCHYCDFYSIGRERTGPNDADLFEKALFREATVFSDPGSLSPLETELDTIFFGGGTPSMTPADSMRRALAPLELERRVTPATEWTMEANPSSITLSSLREYRAFGVNRISMGVQSLRADLLTQLGRVHSRETAIEALGTVFEAGFDNVSTDLLCGVPGQTLDDVASALEQLSEFPITHLSCYLLTLPPSHRMHKDLPHEDEQLAHLLFIDQWMKGKGFEHYEISNFAKPGKRARHNLNYWTGRSYLGLGPSAHSFHAQDGKRWKNVSSLHKYGRLAEAGKSVIEWTETLNDEQRDLEKWMLALRLEEGFPVAWLDSELRHQRVKTLVSQGLLETHPEDGTRRRLTARGFALSDQIISTIACSP